MLLFPYCHMMGDTEEESGEDNVRVGGGVNEFLREGLKQTNKKKKKIYFWWIAFYKTKHTPYPPWRYL